MAYKVKSDDIQAGLKAFLTELIPSALDNGPRALKSKWDQREAVYECDPRWAGPKLFDNVQPYAYDVLGPVIRNVKDAVMASLTGPATYCQAVPVGRTTQEAADVLETGVQTLADLAGIERTLDLALHNALLCGVGFLRCRMDEEGLVVERIHPGDMVIVLHKGGRLKDAGAIGHRFHLPYWEFISRVDAGNYPMVHEKSEGSSSGDLKRFIGRRSSDEPTGYDPGRNPTGENTLTADCDFEDVALYELLVRMEVEGLPDEKKSEGTKWYRVVWSDEASEAVLCEPFPYPDHWYYEIAFHDEEVPWRVQSVAGRILPQAMHQSQMLNLAVTAQMASVTRPVMATGVMGKKITTWRLGQLLQGAVGSKFEALPFDYDGASLLAMTQENDNRINKSAGVTESSLSGEHMKAETATEVSQLAESAQKAEGAKSRFVGDFVEELFQGIHDLCRWHQKVVRKVYGQHLEERFFLALRAKCRWRMTGRVPGSSGNVLIAKLEKALQYALTPGSPYHSGRTIEAIVTALNIADTQSLKKTPEELEQERQAQEAERQMALMAAATGGKPPEAMAAPKNGQVNAAGVA